MKKYRVDEEEDLANRGTRRIFVWVEEIVTIFGEIHYTGRYKLMSRNQLKKAEIIKVVKRYGNQTRSFR